MTARQEHKTSKALLDQQRVLAEFGEFALRAEDLDGILMRPVGWSATRSGPTLRRSWSFSQTENPCSSALVSAGSPEWLRGRCVLG